jgi:OHCU decarboxylase
VDAPPTAGLAEAASALDQEAFAKRFGAVFERSPWVAERAWDHRPFADLDDLHGKLVEAVAAAPHQDRLALIRAHPDLSDRAAILTTHSTREQAAAGLDRLTQGQYDELLAGTAAYRTRFGFPFVICAREHDADSILAALRERVDNDPAHEEETALREIARIARLRLEAMA